MSSAYYVSTTGPRDVKCTEGNKCVKGGYCLANKLRLVIIKANDSQDYRHVECLSTKLANSVLASVSAPNEFARNLPAAPSDTQPDCSLC